MHTHRTQLTTAMVRHLLVIVVMGAVSWPTSAQQAQPRPAYVITTAPTSFPVDFKQRAKDAIENCCGGSGRATLACPAGQTCEIILIEDTPQEFLISIRTEHVDDLSRFGRARYFRGATSDKRQDQVLDWLRALVKCDDIRHHSGGEDRTKLSAYCQVCQLIEPPTIKDGPPTKQPR